jgi:hypothetical protein
VWVTCKGTYKYVAIRSAIVSNAYRVRESFSLRIIAVAAEPTFSC